jgi:hypothetical protein
MKNALFVLQFSCWHFSMQGFLRNLSFLRTVFNPTYTILDMRQCSSTELIARWTMGFDVLFIQKSILGRLWWPRLEFTGTTLYGVNTTTGLIGRHLDTWDSIETQEYFSIEGFAHSSCSSQVPRPTFHLAQVCHLFTISMHKMSEEQIGCA